MMLLVCPNCTTSYRVDAALLGTAGRSVRCVRCRHVWRAGDPEAVARDAKLLPSGPVTDVVGVAPVRRVLAADVPAPETQLSLAAQLRDRDPLAWPCEGELAGTYDATAPLRLQWNTPLPGGASYPIRVELTVETTYNDGTVRTFDFAGSIDATVIYSAISH